MGAKFHENIRRSLVKALIFRILVICTDSIIIYTITHRLDETVGVTLFTNLASTAVYFIHERVWDRIHWGKGISTKL